MEQQTRQTAKCRGCKADILWLDHPVTMKRAPIDAYPTFNGDLIVDREAGTWRHATVAEKAQHPDQLHVSHFVTCAYSKQFRSRGRK